MPVPDGNLSALEFDRRILSYAADTGLFTWVKPPKNHPRMLGQVAGCGTRGYTHIKIHKHAIPAHRLAWLYVYGEWPSMALDHINGNPYDNRIVNLRLATTAQNEANRRRDKGKSLPKGVRAMNRGGGFQARIRVAGKPIHLGAFRTIEDASQAYFDAAKKYYGEFARAD
jgi:HNH endonuclease